MKGMLKIPQPTKIYIAGPMTGLPDDNKPAFYAMEEKLKAMGYKVVNPARLTDEALKTNPNMTRKDFYRQDFHALTECDGIMMIKGWVHSHGARFERQLALEIGCHIFYEEEHEI
jgi:nucleoside 2-deoxyribosyltransferase